MKDKDVHPAKARALALVKPGSHLPYGQNFRSPSDG